MLSLTRMPEGNLSKTVIVSPQPCFFSLSFREWALNTLLRAYPLFCLIGERKQNYVSAFGTTESWMRNQNRGAVSGTWRGSKMQCPSVMEVRISQNSRSVMKKDISCQFSPKIEGVWWGIYEVENFCNNRSPFAQRMPLHRPYVYIQGNVNYW